MNPFRLSIVYLIAALNLCGAGHIPWDLEGAQERIKAHRMGDFNLEVRLPNGLQVPAGARFELKQTGHAFRFGGSLSADWQVPKQACTPFQIAVCRLSITYRQFLLGGSRESAQAVNYLPASREQLDWAKEQGMTLRGHPLMWHEVLPDFMTDSAREVSAIDADIRHHVTRLLKGYPEIDEWDVYNEAVGIKWLPRTRESGAGLNRWVAGEVSARMIDTARSIRPDVRLILNHYTDLDVEYEEQIEHCLEVGAAFEVIGIQTHAYRDGLNWEDRLWGALERYARFETASSFGNQHSEL